MGITDEVQATIEHVRALCEDGIMPSYEAIKESNPPIPLSLLHRYHGIGRAKLAELCGAVPIEQYEQRAAIVRRIAELGEELGKPPTFPEYMANRNGAPSLHTRWKSEWSKMLVEVFGDFSRRGMPVDKGRSLHMNAPLSDADFEQVDHAPPPDLEPKLKWSMGGVMATDAYQDAYGRTVYRLR